MDKDLLILFKPSIHMAENDLSQAGSLARPELPGGSFGNLRVRHDVVHFSFFLFIRNNFRWLQILVWDVLALKVVVWISMPFPTEKEANQEYEWYSYAAWTASGNTHTYLAVLVSTIHSRPKKTRIRLGDGSM